MRLSGSVSIEEQCIVCKSSSHVLCGCVERTPKSGFIIEGNSNLDGFCHERSTTLQTMGSRLSRPGSFLSASSVDDYALICGLGTGQESTIDALHGSTRCSAPTKILSISRSAATSMNAKDQQAVSAQPYAVRFKTRQNLWLRSGAR